MLENKVIIQLFFIIHKKEKEENREMPRVILKSTGRGDHHHGSRGGLESAMGEI